jgi:hypothetical protein
MRSPDRSAFQIGNATSGFYSRSDAVSAAEKQFSTRTKIEALLVKLSTKSDATVTERNDLRDCEIALGRTQAKCATVVEAWSRVVRRFDVYGISESPEISLCTKK